MTAFLNPERPEIARFLERVGAFGVDDCVQIVRRYMRAQHHSADASQVASEIIRGSRLSADDEQREQRMELARRALDRVPGVLRHVPEEIPDGEYLVPLRGIAEQAVFHAVQALLTHEELPPRLRKVLLAPFDGMMDGVFA